MRAFGAYSPESMPEIMDAVYANEGEMVPYMWAAILIYAFWPSMVGHLAMFRNDFLRRLPAGALVMELACRARSALASGRRGKA